MLLNLQRQSGNSGPHEDSLKNNKVVPLIKKLSSASPNDRSMALSAISVLCEDTKLRKIMLKEKLINIVMEQCLNDNNDEIVVESFGLLRNLVIDEGYDVAKFLLRSKILVSIQAGMEKAAKSFEFLNQGSAKTTEKQVLFEFSENLIGLITGLATIEAEIFEEVYPQLEFAIKFVSDLLNWNLNDMSLKISTGLLNSALDFIYQLSTQSSDFISNVSKIIDLQKLITFSQTQKVPNLTKTYTEAIKFHFKEIEGIENKDKFTLDSLNSFYNIMTSIDIKSHIMILNTPPITDKVDKDDAKRRVDSRNDLEAIDISLDMIATLTEFDAAIEVAEDTSEGLIQFYLQKLTPILLELLAFKDQSFLNKSIIALNNLSWLFFDMEEKPTAWFQVLETMWNSVFPEFLSLQDSTDFESMTDYLQLLVVLTRSLGQTLQGNISPEQISKILRKSSDIQDSLEDVDLIKKFFILLIGFLTSVASIQSQIEVTKLIGDHYLQLIRSCLEVINNSELNQNLIALRQSYLFQMIIVECLSSIFEVFGDKNFDYDSAVYVSNNYNQQLAEIEPALKPAFKLIDKNKDSRLRDQLMNVASTLVSFIDYKKNE